MYITGFKILYNINKIYKKNAANPNRGWLGNGTRNSSMIMKVIKDCLFGGANLSPSNSEINNSTRSV